MTSHCSRKWVPPVAYSELSWVAGATLSSPSQLLHLSLAKTLCYTVAAPAALKMRFLTYVCYTLTEGFYYALTQRSLISVYCTSCPLGTHMFPALIYWCKARCAPSVLQEGVDGCLAFHSDRLREHPFMDIVKVQRRACENSSALVGFKVLCRLKFLHLLVSKFWIPKKES